MGCNAWNHGANCPCDFRGGHGYGGRGSGRRAFFADAVEQLSPGWSRARGDGAVASYVNPNARCPVCHAPVIFYRSPYDGRVFFNPPLGPPWPKHPCTDNSGWRSPAWRGGHGSLPVRAAPTSIMPATRTIEPSPQEEGWEPLCSSKTHVSEGRMVLTGDLGGQFTELWLFDVPTFDRDGPILTRAREEAPGFHVIAVLRSDHSGTRERYHIAFEPRLAPLGTELLCRVNDDDDVALTEVGRFMLYGVGDVPGAIVYLERALAGGVPDVALDLAVAALFVGAARRRTSRPTVLQRLGCGSKSTRRS
jgi:hypothetical protein